MARYHFDIETNHQNVKDEEGSDYIDRLSVRNVAIASLPMIAADDLPDGDDYHATVFVRDENGQPIFKATLKVSATWLDEVAMLQ